MASGQWAFRRTDRVPSHALADLAVHATLWGLWIGFVAGAAAATAMVPILYTPFGAVVGTAAALVPTILTTAYVAGFATRHQPLTDPVAFLDGLHRIFRRLRWIVMAVGAAVVAGGYGPALIRDYTDYGGPVVNAVGVFLWIGVGPFLVASWVMWRLLPKAALGLTLAFAERSGWEVAKVRPRASPGSPPAGDSLLGGPLGRGFTEGAS